MTVGLNSSIGQYNGILNNGVQYPAIQGYTYQPQTSEVLPNAVRHVSAIGQPTVAKVGCSTGADTQ